jgi:hypothetical protein
MRTSIVVVGALLMCALLPCNVHAIGVDLVFLGVLGNDAPAIEKTFDTRMREALSVNPEYHMLDYLASQDFRQRIGFDDFPTVSRRLVEGLRQFNSDSTVFVWVSVTNRMIHPVRRWWVRASALGEMTLKVNMYSLRFKEYAFIGDVTTSAEKSQGFIFFYPLEKGVHISALDQQEITEKLVAAAAFRSAELITAVVKSEKQKALLVSDSGGMSKYKASSISDMFSVPSVEGANLERGRKREQKTPQPAVEKPASAKEPDKKANAAPVIKPAKPAAKQDTTSAPASSAIPAKDTANSSNAKPSAPPSPEKDAQGSQGAQSVQPEKKPANADSAVSK